MEYLHSILLVEFKRYSSTGVQLSRSLIQSIAVELLQEPDSPFAADEFDSLSNKTLSNNITVKWVDAFLSRYKIAIRKQSGSLSRSPTQTRLIEKTEAYHLKQLHSGLRLEIWSRTW